MYTPGPSEANARLIAAAPDLLAAILNSDDAHWTPAMRAAIQKALPPSLRPTPRTHGELTGCAEGTGMRYASNADLIAIVKARINYETTERDIANEFGISASYLSDFLQGKRDAGPAILKALGFDEQPFYKRTTANT
jgi:hypothetical protein